MSPPQPVAMGTVLAQRYEVTKELGRGGMGIVYCCRDASTGEIVALKRLHREDAKSDPEDAWWFQQEARALASLDHPTIVHARDFGILADGAPFLVMDVARGRSLLGWLEVGAIPWPWPFTVLWSFADQILAGLAHAHARAVIHGDLKPTNLMLDFTGSSTVPRISILDLGLASLVRDTIDHRLDGGEGSPRVVRAGAGTPGWMAPEQIRRATPHYGPPTDLYALGCILFHLLSGREPFTGTVEEVLDGHRNAPVPELPLPPNAPAEAGAFVRRLLAKRPWQRFEYAGDARAAWERFRPKQRTERWSFRVDPKIDKESLPPPPPSPRGDGSGASAPMGFAPGLLGLRPSPLVARAEERAELLAIADEMCSQSDSPSKRLVLLYGEAGVGKSRLAEWLCEQVHEKAQMVPLRARYRKIPAPLDGVVGAINAHFGLERADRNLVEQTLLNCWESRDSDEERTWVAATAEWLRPTPPGTTVALGPTGKRFFLDTPEVRRRIIFRALAKIGQNRPLCLWLDDLHLSSQRTFELLSKLPEHLPDVKIMLVATVRSEAVAVDGEALSRVERLRELYAGRVLELRALSHSDTEQLLLSSLPLEKAAVHRAAERSKGNPLFALQLLHAWAASNRLHLNNGRYEVPASALEVKPGSTADLWDERLSAIPPEMRLAALAASALGGDIPLAVLRALLRNLEVPVNGGISELHRAQILIPAGPDRLRWPHALLQEHLLAKLMDHPNNKIIFHLAADALALHPAAGTRRVVSHRVTNLLRAGNEAAVVERVLEFVESNWKRVRDVGATLNDLSRLEGLVSGPAMAAYARWRAEALRHLGQFAEARDLANRAREAFAQMGDEKSEAHCLRLIGHILSAQGAALGRDYVLFALRRFESLKDAGGRAECEVVLGEMDYLLGDHKRARNWLIRAAGRYAKLADPLGRGQCLILLGLIELTGGRLERAGGMLQEARREFENLGYRLGIAQCEIARGQLAHRGDDFELAEAYARSAKKMMLDLGNPRGQASCERLLAMIALDADQLGEAREHALAAAASYDQLGDPWGQVESALLLAQVALSTQNPVARDLVGACRQVTLSEAEPRQHLALTEAWLAFSEGRAGEAEEALEKARGMFSEPKQICDHGKALLTRLLPFAWPSRTRKILDQWSREVGAV